MAHRRLRLLHTRRDVLRYVGGVTAAAALPIPVAGCNSSSTPPPSTGFFTADELTALTALVNAIIPPDDEPGASDLGAIQYIENLMTAFDNPNAPPFIYAGGPFSGRAPYADPLGQPSTSYPPNSFVNFLSLDMVKQAGWQLMILGPSALPNGAPNQALRNMGITGLDPVVGLQDQMKQGLAAAIANAPGPLDQMSTTDIITYFNTLEITFKQLLTALVTQGCFCPPEYGGNTGLEGWRITHFEGDQQPLGYSVWSTELGQYVQRPDAPMSTPTVTDPEPLTEDVIMLLDMVVAALGGTVFQS